MAKVLQLGDGRQWTVWDIHIEPHYLAKPLPSSLQWQGSDRQLAHWNHYGKLASVKLQKQEDCKR